MATSSAVCSYRYVDHYTLVDIQGTVKHSLIGKL